MAMVPKKQSRRISGKQPWYPEIAPRTSSRPYVNRQIGGEWSHTGIDGKPHDGVWQDCAKGCR